MDRHPRCGH